MIVEGVCFLNLLRRVFTFCWAAGTTWFSSGLIILMELGVLLRALGCGEAVRLTDGVVVVIVACVVDCG